MNKYLLSAVLIVFAGVTIYTTLQTEFDESGQLDVVFYNVENLFDIEDDPLTLDDEFTPDNTKHWTVRRYENKLANLVKVISQVPKSGLPEVIGLCEIENRKVVEDLIKTDTLVKRKYVIIHEESPDKRGIDVAFIYDELVMKELHHEAIRYNFSFEPETTTRDILYAKMLAKKDTLHFFINHWPSRAGDSEKTEPKRIEAAKVLRTKIDSILLKDINAKIIAMGDFNDYPNNLSMTEVMNCEPGADQQLTNLSYEQHENGEGTYNFRGEWGMLDQFIVSDGILNTSKGLGTSDTSAFIFKRDWLLFKEKGKPAIPNRTFGGSNYYGGYSDHLPIGLSLNMK